MTALWTHRDAAAATGGCNTAAWAAEGVSIDSRSLSRGDLFIAIRGNRSDGHDYVADALGKGAAAAMIANDWRTPPPDAPLLTVEDTDDGMCALARAARDRSNAQVIGVTGSVGKTGTKEMLAHALGAQGATASTRGNLNNHWGLPLSLARMPQDTAFGVFELGMNHAGEIEPLSRLTRPDVAIVTTVEATHLEFFDSEEGIADAKAEIFSGVPDGGAAVLNRDNRHFDRLRRHAEAQGVGRICAFGEHEEADIRLLKTATENDGSRVQADIAGEKLDYVVGAPGKHWAMNSLAVLAAVRSIGADWRAAAATLASIRPMKGRGRQQTVAAPSGGFLLIDESYNASPASVRAALDVLGAAEPGSGGRRIAVLGDMLEIGAAAAEAHAGLAADIERNRIDIVFAAGKDMAHLKSALSNRVVAHHGPDSEAILDLVLDTVKAGDVVTVKGSLGSRMIPIAEALLALGRGADARTRAAEA